MGCGGSDTCFFSGQDFKPSPAQPGHKELSKSCLNWVDYDSIYMYIKNNFFLVKNFF